VLKSKDFKNTQNLYLEGDNIHVLKLPQETYMGKTKVIYIDPPYNTGKDTFTYSDRFAVDSKEFAQRIGLYDDDCNVRYDMRESAQTNGRFHTDWLNMIYPRLKLSKDLLTDYGVILISIDECEIENLLNVGNEIFGERNYIGSFVWNNRTTPNDSQLFYVPVHEYIVIYAREIENVVFKGVAKDLSNYTNPDNDPNGKWIKDNPSAASGSERDRFAIINPYTAEEYYPPKGRFWAFSRKRVAEWTERGKLVFRKRKAKTLY
jgi:adenine-specific DNA-methyltransferase